MSDISPSRIQTDAEFEGKISRMDNFEEIRKAMRDRAIEQNLVRPDNDPFHVIEINQPAPKTFAEIVQIGNQKIVVEGDSELDLARKVSSVYRSRMGGEQQQTQTQQTRDEQQTQQQTQQPRNDRGQFTSQEEIERQATEAYERSQLLIQFQIGQITPEDYLEKTGAIDGYLAKRGITPEVLEKISDQNSEQMWADSVEKFILRHPEWQGGTDNRDLVISLITDSGMLDKIDRGEATADEALEAAYIYGLQHDVFVESADAEHERLLSEAKSQADVDFANLRFAERTGMGTNVGSTFWGSR